MVHLFIFPQSLLAFTAPVSSSNLVVSFYVWICAVNVIINALLEQSPNSVQLHLLIIYLIRGRGSSIFDNEFMFEAKYVQLNGCLSFQFTCNN